MTLPIRFSSQYQILAKQINKHCGMLAALSFLLFLPVAPALAEVSCEPLQRGTLSDDGVFTPATQPSDTDYRAVCTGSGQEDDRVDWGQFFDSADAVGADEFSEEARGDPGTRLILELDNAYADLGTNQFPLDGAESVYRIVVLGTSRGGVASNEGVNIWVGTLSADLNFDSYADIQTTGGARGISVGTGEEDSERTLRVRNFGSVLTEGEGTPENPRRAYGINLNSDNGNVEVSNEVGATIETRGKGGRGIVASTNGDDATATAVNRGSVVTQGDPLDSTTAYGVVTFANGIRGTARSINEAGGTIRTEGEGARGLYASGGTAISTNRGSVLTTGVHAEGVRASASGISAMARAANEAGGAIRTEGSGSIGLNASYSDGASGHAETENWGEITITGGLSADGRSSAGIESKSRSGNAVTWNRATGRVHTTGEVAVGVRAGSNGDGATSRSVNEGSILTEGREAFGLQAWNTRSNGGRSEVINRASGRVETRGDRAFGLLTFVAANGSEASSFAESTNEGTVITRGTNSDGVLAVADSGGTEAHPNSVRSINKAGATIETEGDGSSGLNASIGARGTGPVDTFGTAWAENHGTITTAGGVLEEELARAGRIASGAPGVIAAFFPWEDDTEVGNAGDVTVVNTGDVTATGGSAGLAAETYGTGTATVRMTGGSVTSGAMDNPDTQEDESTFGIGISAAVHTDSTGDDPSDDTDVHITVSGPSTTVTAYGATADDPTTDSWDESRGVGIFGQTGDTGHIQVEVSGSAIITADRAAVFEGGRTTFNLFESTLVGDIEFASLDDQLTIRNSVVAGDVHFGDGTDTLVLDVPDSGGITGRITGLEELLKRGAGVARIFDAELSDNVLAIEEGELSLAGHLNLGSLGTLTVHDESRLSVEVGDLTEDGSDHGRITAGGGVIYEGLEENEAPVLFLQLASDARANADAIQTVLEESPIDVLGVNTRVRIQTDEGPVDASEAMLKTADADGSTRAIGTVGQNGQVQLAEDASLIAPPEEVEPFRSRRGGSNSGLIILGGGGLLAAILMSDVFDDEEAALADWEEAGAERRTTTSFTGIGSGHAIEHRMRSGNLEQWTRTFAGDSPTLAGGVAGSVNGLAMGLDARLGGGFQLGMAAMPALSVSAHPGPGLDNGSDLEGGHYVVRGGWRGDSLFADTSLSHGRYRAKSIFDNPVSGGALGGEFGLAQSQIKARAGIRLGLGTLRTTPSFSLFSGSLRQSAYTAQSATLRAEVPSISQRYQGWKAGLNLSPADWVEGPRAFRWRPALHLSSTRTHTTTPAGLNVLQSDKAGVLSFSSRARARGLPRMVHSLGASVTAMQSDTWRLRVGYAGMVVDGEPIQAALARLHVRF